VDVALEARARRWTVEERDARVSLVESAVVPASEPPAEGAIRVTYGGVMRVAVLAGDAPDVERVLRRAVLASGAELVLLLRANDARSLVERAAAIRAARPDLVLALVAERGEAAGIVDLVEALRLGCADRSPAPRVVVAGEPHAALRLKAAAVGYAVELLPDPRRADGISAFAHRGREFRRGTDADVVLRDEALEELARLVAAHGNDTLIVDVAGGSTSLVRASADGAITAAHVAHLGSGVAADRTVGRAGLDGVRRWIPWAIDAPTMLERVFNRARWPDAVAAEASALALEIALAHEAVSHALGDAAAAGIAEPLRHHPASRQRRRASRAWCACGADPRDRWRPRGDGERRARASPGAARLRRARRAGPPQQAAGERQRARRRRSRSRCVLQRAAPRRGRCRGDWHAPPSPRLGG